MLFFYIYFLDYSVYIDIYIYYKYIIYIYITLMRFELIFFFFFGSLGNTHCRPPEVILSRLGPLRVTSALYKAGLLKNGKAATKVPRKKTTQKPAEEME